MKLALEKHSQEDRKYAKVLIDTVNASQGL